MNEKKIYIVLTQTYTTIARIIKSITKDKYSHASISLDIKCNNMYSFGRKYIYFPFYGIFLKEDLRKGLFIRNKNALVVIYEIKVTKKQYNKIKEIELNNKGYNIIGLLLAHFRVKLHRRKYYCSEFAYEVLSDDEVKLIERNDDIFKPEYLIKELNYNKLFEGMIVDYIN